MVPENPYVPIGRKCFPVGMYMRTPRKICFKSIRRARSELLYHQKDHEEVYRLRYSDGVDPVSFLKALLNADLEL